MKRTKTNNAGVIAAWHNGTPARNARGSFTTDGDALYSYGLKIGMRAGNTLVIADYTAGTNSFQTQTTSCHVGLAKAHANLVMHPKVWAASPLSGTGWEDVPF